MDSFFLLSINLSRSDGQSVIRITLGGGGSTFLRVNESHFIPRLLLFIFNTQYLSNFDGFSLHFFIFLASLFLGVLEYGFKKILDRKKGEGEGYKLPK